MAAEFTGRPCDIGDSSRERSLADLVRAVGIERNQLDECGGVVGALWGTAGASGVSLSSEWGYERGGGVVRGRCQSSDRTFEILRERPGRFREWDRGLVGRQRGLGRWAGE